MENSSTLFVMASLKGHQAHFYCLIPQMEYELALTPSTPKQITVILQEGLACACMFT